MSGVILSEMHASRPVLRSFKSTVVANLITDSEFFNSSLTVSTMGLRRSQEVNLVIFFCTGICTVRKNVWVSEIDFQKF
jgi:hypothetical protein